MTKNSKEPRPKDAELLKAIRIVVQRAGGPKRVASAIWPELTNPRTAHQKLLACLDPRRREHFTPEDLMLLFRFGRDAGDHLPMELFCTFSGYSKPTPLYTEDERVELNRRFILAVDEQKKAVARWEELMVLEKKTAK